MNPAVIRLLQSIRGFPAVSILLPTHRVSPDNRQDPIRLKNLISEAADRLLAEASRPLAHAVVGRLEGLASEIDFRYTWNGLALFANPDFGARYDLPFSPEGRVAVGDTFAIRDLVFAFNRTPRYRALVLSEKPTSLYKGSAEGLIEVLSHGFPMSHEGPGGSAPLPGGPGINKAAYADEMHRRFFRQVDAALSQIQSEDPLPIVAIGIDRYQAFFQEVTKNDYWIVGRVYGSHDRKPSHEIARLAWPLVEKHMRGERRKILAGLEEAVGKRQQVSGLVEVWRAGQEGRGELLIVEEGYRQPARADATGLSLTLQDDPTGVDVIDDAVDELIQSVLAKSGKVVFVEDGALRAHQRIALVLRY